MTLLETKYEVEIRCYSNKGNLLNTQWVKDCKLKDLIELFPDEDFTDEERDSVWIETKKQADYFGVNYKDLDGIGYEIFLPVIDESN